MSFTERFWEKVEKGPSCWLWMACTTRRGYGQIRREGKTLYTHRVSLELHNITIPEGTSVLHRCDTPACVNPDHLFLGTQLDNMRDCVKKCRHTHGENHGNSKLAEVDVLEILDATGTQREIADEYGVDQSLISYIKNNKIWKHIAPVAVFFLMVTTGFALTPKEKVVVEHAKVAAHASRDENILAWSEAKAAYDSAYSAEQHAIETDTRANTLDGQVKAYQKQAEAVAKERDKMLPVYKEVTRWWGLGAFVWGFKQLLKHLLILSIVAVVLVGAIWALSFVFPVAGIAFSWLMSMIKKLLNMLRK